VPVFPGCQHCADSRGSVSDAVNTLQCVKMPIPYISTLTWGIEPHSAFRRLFVHHG